MPHRHPNARSSSRDAAIPGETFAFRFYRWLQATLVVLVVWSVPFAAIGVA